MELFWNDYYFKFFVLLFLVLDFQTNLSTLQILKCLMIEMCRLGWLTVDDDDVGWFNSHATGLYVPSFTKPLP